MELPPWAFNNPQEFIRQHRAALESNFVSANIHKWIDLIYGHKQQGQAALDADNLFYHLTYEGALEELQREADPRRRVALEAQIQEFGQVPTQLFDGPHPCRDDVGAPLLVANPEGKRGVKVKSAELGGSGDINAVTASAAPEPVPGTSLWTPSGSPPAPSQSKPGTAGRASLFQWAENTAALLDKAIFGASSRTAHNPLQQQQQQGPQQRSDSVRVSGKVQSSLSGDAMASLSPMCLSNGEADEVFPQKPRAVVIDRDQGLFKGGGAHADSVPLRRCESIIFTLPTRVTSMALSGGSQRGSPPILCCCCESDESLRVWQLDLEPKRSSRDVGYSSSGKAGHNVTRASLRHSFMMSPAGLTGCGISGDGTLVVVSSLDSKVYRLVT